MYMYVCLYMYVCICMHVYVCMYMYVCICMCMCVYVCVYVCMCMCVYAYMCMYVSSYVVMDERIRGGGEGVGGEMSHQKGGKCPGELSREELSYTLPHQ